MKRYERAYQLWKPIFYKTYPDGSNPCQVGRILHDGSFEGSAVNLPLAHVSDFIEWLQRGYEDIDTSVPAGDSSVVSDGESA